MPLTKFFIFITKFEHHLTQNLAQLPYYILACLCILMAIIHLFFYFYNEFHICVSICIIKHEHTDIYTLKQSSLSSSQFPPNLYIQKYFLVQKMVIGVKNSQKLRKNHLEPLVLLVYDAVAMGGQLLNILAAAPLNLQSVGYSNLHKTFD